MRLPERHRRLLRQLLLQLTAAVRPGGSLARRPLSRASRMTTLALTSLLTCPTCGFAETLVMPTDACLFFHECAGCHTLLRPKAGDCCVFCSYGSAPCPPIQADGSCGGDAVGGDATGCCGASRTPATASGPSSPTVDS